MKLFIILMIPVFVTFICMAFGQKKYISAWATIIGNALVLMLCMSLVFNSGLFVQGRITELAGWLSCDGLSALIVLLVAFIGFTASLFSIGYIKENDGSHSSGEIQTYYALYNLFLLSMLAVPLLTHLAIIWIAVELTTLLSVFLVGFENTSEALEAAWKYVVLTCMGAAIALIGILILYWGLHISGSDRFTWSQLIHSASKINPVFLKTGFLFILVGFGTKAGLVPLHTWLPDAHSQAPSPVCALLSGIETTTALYVILRLLPILDRIPGKSSALSPWFVAFGLISVGTAAFLLIQVKDYKRLFAFSTIEHMGIILVAAGLGGEAAHLAAVSQIMAHAFTKSFCFFAAGSALLVTGTRDISSVRGLFRTSPIAGFSLMLGGLAIAGAPPFAIFFSEFSIIKAGLAAGHYLIIGVLVSFIAIAFCGIMYQINQMVFGEPLESSTRSVTLPSACLLTLAIAGIPIIILGIYMPHDVHNLLQLAASCLGR